MLKTPLPENEPQRLAALRSLGILDTLPEERFERITRIAQRLFDVPITSITLIDANRQWSKSCVGLPSLETSRDMAFCAHAILSDEALVIPDAKLDPRFADNPLVTGEPYIRFYAGQPLTDASGYKIGTLCIIDRKSRQFTSADQQNLKDLSFWAENELNNVELSRTLALQRESEARLRAQAILLDLAHDTIMVRDLHTSAITFWNQGAEKMYGWSKEEALGNVSHTFLHTQFPEPQEQIEAELLSDGHWEGELTHVRHDGQHIMVASRWALQRNEQNEPIAILEINNDITLRKRAEAELEQQYDEARRVRSELMAVFNATSEAIILISSDRRFLSVNRQFTKFFGLRPEQVVRYRFDEFEAEVERIFVDPAAFKALVADTAANTELRFTEVVAQQWPVPRELELFSTPVQSTSNEYLGRLYVLRDVTQQREVDRMKSEFVSLVSHELRTPLTSIKGYVDLLLDGDAGDITEEQQEYLDIVKNNSDRLIALINDLLDVSRIESGKIKLHGTALDLARLISEAVSSLRPQIEAKDQHLTLEVDKALPAIWGEADRITQILVNLLSNAYKYTLPGGAITLRAYEVGKDFVRVDVQDTGIGLSPAEQAQLFTKFFRAKNEATQDIGGTGLGLTITRSLVEMHGGEITVVSQLGIGSTFSFILPTTSEVVRHEVAHPPAQVSGTVLVVDDEPDIANLIRRYLEHAGYHVFIAHSAAEALTVAKAEHPDLITLDIILPDADGFTLLEWFKSDTETTTIPVIMLSMMDDAQRGKLLGAVGYLRKPVQEQILLERIASVLAANSESTDELEGQEKREARTHIILVADDDTDVRSLIAGNLHRVGYQVIEAIDGYEAVEMARHTLPDLALIDIKMPRLDGISVLRMLRAEMSTRNLPVIMMTTSPAISEENISVVEALGGSLLFSKPYTAKELAMLIARNLNSGT